MNLDFPPYFLVWTKPFGPGKKGKQPHISTVCAWNYQDCVNAAEAHTALKIAKIRRLGGRIRRVKITIDAAAAKKG